MEQTRDDIAPTIDQASRPSAKRSRTAYEHSNTGEDSKTRLRVTQACNECRRRKDRCDGNRPYCNRCLTCNRECRYNESSKKRGLRSGYVRTLEILLGFVFSTVEGTEAWVTAILASKATSPSFHLRISAETAQDAAENALHLWRRSHVLAEIERLGLFACSGEDEDESSDRLNRRLSESLAFATAQSRKGVLSTPSLGSNVSIDAGPTRSSLENLESNYTAPVQIDPIDLLLPPEPIDNLPHSSSQPSTSSWSAEGQPVKDLLLPPNWQQLLDKYFKSTHCWLPISERHDLLRIAYSLPKEEFPTSFATSSSRGDHAFLAAVFAYILHQERDTSSSKHPDKDVLRLSLLANDFCEAGNEACGLGHVRALLVLTLLKISQNEWEHAWITVGRAVYIMVSICENIGTSATSGSIEEGHKRTFLGCFALETLIAIRLQRRTYLHYSDLQRIGLLSTNTVEEWEPWHLEHNRGDTQNFALGHILSIFNQFVELLGMLNDLQCRSNNTISADAHFMHLATRFKAWLDQVPQFSGTGESPQLLNLKLATATTQAMLELEAGQQLSSTSADRLMQVTEIIQSTPQGTCFSRRSTVPPSLEVFLFKMDTLLSHHESSEMLGLQGYAKDLHDRIKGLRSHNHRNEPGTGDGSNVDNNITHSNFNFAAAAQSNDALSQDPTLQASHTTTAPWSPDDDNILFDSLATLDSVDWLSNLPDFVRNLGGPRNASPDLQALIDGAF